MNFLSKKIKYKKYPNNYSGASCGKIGGINKCALMQIVLAIIILISFLSSCNTEKEIDPNFIDTYKNILVVRERFVDDSLTAARKVDSVMKAHNYTEPEFKEDYFMYAKEYNKQFVNAIDSLRDMVREQYDSLKAIREKLEQDTLDSKQ